MKETTKKQDKKPEAIANQPYPTTSHLFEASNIFDLKETEIMKKTSILATIMLTLTLIFTVPVFAAEINTPDTNEVSVVEFFEELHEITLTPEG